MKEYYNESEGIYVKELTYKDWLEGVIIRDHEDDEFDYLEGPNGPKTNNPNFRRRPISEYIGLFDCENGWMEPNLRIGKPTLYIVADDNELEKVRAHLESQYWRLVESKFQSLCYAIKQNMDASSNQMLLKHELEKVNYAFEPNSFRSVPVLVSQAETVERKEIESISVIYADFMRNGRQCHEPYNDSLHFVKHYLVDAYLKYKDWLESFDSVSSKEIKRNETISYPVIALVLSYEGNRVTSPSQCLPIIKRFGKPSTQKILKECTGHWGRSARLEPLNSVNNIRKVKALRKKIESACLHLNGASLETAKNELQEVEAYLKRN